MARLPARWNGIVFPLVLSVFMTALVSLVATLRAVGLPPDILSRWLSAWALSWVVAFPALLLVLPVVRRLVAHLVEPGGSR